MSFKMVAVDVDWTLLDERGRIPGRVFKAFKKITSTGGYVVIATGRGMESASEVFLENDYPLGRDGYPHALTVGSHLFYLQDGEYVPDEAWNVNVGKWWSESRPLAKEIMDAIVPKLGGIEYERVWEDGLLFTSLEDAVQVQELIIQYMRKEGIDAVFLERNGWGVGLSDARVGKGNCLDRIARKMGLKPEEIVAVGDSNNDRPMLDGQMGFFPACPANSDEEVKNMVSARHGFVAKQNYGMGVAEIIESLFQDRGPLTFYAEDQELKEVEDVL
ncbi:MAG: HAD family phosphatase [Candidatus Latescibacteria bacterium]|nr:HAD family phosphatase [Candidatus Latescibacterota bacterium]